MRFATVVCLILLSRCVTPTDLTKPDDTKGSGSNDGSTGSTGDNSNPGMTGPTHHDPMGADLTLTIDEDTSLTFATANFGFSDPNDTPADGITGVKITTLPSHGVLMQAGGAVIVGQVITSVTDLVFTPAPNENGAAYATIGFAVQDAFGTDATENTLTIDVTPINDPPSATDATLTASEDTAFVLGEADFGFGDPDDTPPNVLASVELVNLPLLGSISLMGIALSAGQSVTRADLVAGRVVYLPPLNANGVGFDSFGFVVTDDGGGSDDTSALHTITFDVTPVNDAPTTADAAITLDEDIAYTIPTATFAFADPSDMPADRFSAVHIVTVPANGMLAVNSTLLAAGDDVPKGEIDLGHLRFYPPINANGVPFGAITFTVKDDGPGSLASTVHTITINITPVNDPPRAYDNTVSTLEDTDFVFAAASFAFADLYDTPPNAFSFLHISTLPAVGMLRLNGTPVSVDQEVPKAALDLGQLIYTPPPNAFGAALATFDFLVRDDGGGVDTSGIYTITIDVTSNNDAPTDVAISTADVTNTVYLLSYQSLPPGFLIGELSGTDVDDPSLTFALVAGTGGTDNAAYAIAGTGLTAQSAVTQVQTSIRVAAVDSSSATHEEVFTVVLDSPPTAAAVNGALYENHPGTTLTLFAQDFDGARDVFTFDFANTCGGADNAGFTIQGNTLTAVPSYDHETELFKVLCVTATDGAGASVTTQIVLTVLNVNEPPSSSSLSIALDEDATYTFSGIDFAFSDFDSGPNALAGVKIVTTPSGGTLMVNNVAISAGTIVSAADLVAGNFTYAMPPDGNGSDSFTFQVQDDGGTDNDGVDLSSNAYTVSITVNPIADPTVIGVRAAATYVENASPVTLDPGLTLTDPDGDVITSATVALFNFDVLSDNLAFTPTANISGSYDVNTGTLSLNGTATLAEYELVFRSITFDTPKDNPPTQARSVSFSVNGASQGMTVNVTAVNDAPTIVHSGTVTVNEDAPTSFATLALDDADSPDLTFTATALHGTLSYAIPPPGATVTGNGTSLLTATGTTAVIKAWASNLVYHPATNYNETRGAETVSFTVDDGELTATVDAPITVTAVNDAPSMPPQTVAVQTHMLTHVQLQMNQATDPDASDGSFTFSPTLASVTNVGCGNVELTITDAATGAFDVLPPSGFAGQCSLQGTLADNGNGSGGTQTATFQITIDVQGPLIVFVDKSATGGTPDGRWDGTNAHAYRTIQAAENSGMGRTIFVAAASGPYTENVSPGIGNSVIGSGIAGADFNSVLLGAQQVPGVVAGPAIGGPRPLVSGNLVVQFGGVDSIDVILPPLQYSLTVQCSHPALPIRNVHLQDGGLSLVDCSDITLENVDIDAAFEPTLATTLSSGDVTFDAQSTIRGFPSFMTLASSGSGTMRFLGPVAITGTSVSITGPQKVLFAGGLSITSAFGDALTTSSPLGICAYEGCGVGPSGPVVNTISAAVGGAIRSMGGDAAIAPEGITLQSLTSTNATQHAVSGLGSSRGGKLEVTGIAGITGSGGTISGASAGGVRAVASELRLANMIFNDATVSDFAGPQIEADADTVVLDHLELTGGHTTGIRTVGAVDATITNSNIKDAGVSNGATSVYGVELASGGPVLIQTTRVENSKTANVLVNPSSGQLAFVNIADDELVNAPSLVSVRSGSGPASVSVTRSRLTGFTQYAIDCAAQTFNADLAVIDNVIQTSTAPTTAIAVTSNAGIMRYQVRGNGTEPFSTGQSMTASNGIYMISSGIASREVHGTIEANKMTVTDSGINAYFTNDRKHVLRIASNQIDAQTPFAVQGLAAGATPAPSAFTAVNNTLTTSSGQVNYFAAGNGQPIDTCFDFGGLSGGNVNFLGGPITMNVVTDALSTLRLPGYAGGPTDASAVQSYLFSRNAMPGPPNVFGGIAQYVDTPGSAPCEQPILPP